MLRGLIEKLHNFRLLPVFVIVSMVIGVVLGKGYGTSLPRLLTLSRQFFTGHTNSIFQTSSFSVLCSASL